MELKPLTPTLGAEIFGLDLNHALDDATQAAVEEAFDTHRILVFRNQTVSGAAQVAFSLRFGELESHVRRSFRSEALPELHVVSNLDANRQPTRAVTTLGNYHWHTDKSYMARPSLATVLHAIELPPTGGDTCFADMCAAYEDLPESDQLALAQLFAVHSWETSRIKSGSPPATEQEKQDAPPVRHPLVREHARTGRCALYLGNHAGYIEGLPRAEGEQRLEALLDHATQERFVYRHRWQLGDLIMGHNPTLLHRALTDFDLAAHRRVLHRTVVRGTPTH